MSTISPKRQENISRENTRVSDRFIIALPRELTPEQCIENVSEFCKATTRNPMPWRFVLHAEFKGKGIIQRLWDRISQHNPFRKLMRR